MACKDCERRRAQMKSWLVKKAEQAAKWARARNAKRTTEAQSKQADGPKAPARGGRQAGKARAQHGQQGVAAPAPVNPGEGRVSVPGVRAASDGEGSSR